MKIFVVVASLLSLLSSAYAVDLKKGKEIAQSQCVACHGADGNSVNPDWPKLAGQKATYLAKQLKNFKAAMTKSGKVRRENAVMGPLTMALSTQDMENVAAYYANQETKKGGVKKEWVDLGETIYYAGIAKKGIPACTACHGPKGNGLDLAGYPSLAGQHVKYTVTQMKAFQKAERNNDPNAIMRSIAKKMSDEEIQAVSEYVIGLH